MTSGATDTEASATTGARGPAAAPAAPGSVATAVVLATAPAAGRDRPAALLPWDGGTVLGRLIGQLGTLGVSDLRVLTRPEWLPAVSEAVPATVQASRAPADDVREIASLARGAGGGIVILPGEVVTHASALAGLLKDPRVATGVLTGGGVYPARQPSFRVRSKRGRVMSAASPYHSVHKPTGSFLGVLKVDAADRRRLASAADRLAALVEAPPAAWLEELARKEQAWRLSAWRAGRAPEDEPDEEEPEGLDEEALDDEEAGTAPAAESIVLSEADEARLADRIAAAPDDVASLLLVGLVRDRAQVTVSRLRRLFWARPLSPAAIDAARERIAGYDEDKVLLDSAVKASDGFFTTFFVSTYSRYIARWAAHRGFTPNQVTTVSLFIGVLAAAAFATGQRWGLVTGAILLQAAFTTDCVDGQLARYTRTFSKLGAWLDSIFDRSKEYVCFAGLAIGASAAGDPVWTLACAAITLQTARHFSDFSFGAGQTRLIGDVEQPPVEGALDAAGIVAAERRATRAAEPETTEQAPRPAAPVEAQPLSRRVLRGWHTIDRLPGVRWIKKMIAFPIGERFAAISLTAALFDPRVTFVVLLAWGGFAVVYTLSGRVLRSIAR